MYDFITGNLSICLDLFLLFCFVLLVLVSMLVSQFYIFKNRKSNLRQFHTLKINNCKLRELIQPKYFVNLNLSCVNFLILQKLYYFHENSSTSANELSHNNPILKKFSKQSFMIINQISSVRMKHWQANFVQSTEEAFLYEKNKGRYG